MSLRFGLFGVLALSLLSALCVAAEPTQAAERTASPLGITALVIFVLAYAFVISEELLHLRKSKPVLVAAGVIWILAAVAYGASGREELHAQLEHNLLEYVELLLFLLSAMTYINTLDERRVFEALRAWLVSRGLSLRAVFWATGGLAFCISPMADNLTTALVMGAVVMAVAQGNRRFIALACINVVVAANAGGAFSPFGDITTLMVWQAGLVEFHEFFDLLLPSAVNWLVPALVMSLFVPRGRPEAMNEVVHMKQGAVTVIVLFIATIATAVTFYNVLHLPPMLGMMTGLGVLKLYGYLLRKDEMGRLPHIGGPEQLNLDPETERMVREHFKPKHQPFDIFISMKRAEWDTLMFFYGVILCVGGLGAFGYLAMTSEVLYTHWGATSANVSVGLLSAIVDNIPVMFAVLSMEPHMAHGQWLLVTLTAGVGGSLLSIGSAAGVALMGQARGVYTFFNHLKWTPVIALGYVASIWLHMWFNADLF